MFFRSLRIAIICLLNAYKEDFNDPPRYSILNHLLNNFSDKDVQKQAHNLLEEFQQLEENSPSDTTNTCNPLKSKDDSLYNQQGFDYVTPWNILDMPSTTIAEQLTIVDAVGRMDRRRSACFQDEIDSRIY